MSCPCDKRDFPPKLKIAAGLKEIPRQVATFPEFRAAMLARIAAKSALSSWRARGEDDLGLMLLEMWAYVCDVISFYDEVIAHEAYLRTARLRPSLRRLVDLLGYVPQPAVGATVKLALLAEGRQAVSLPQGTAFRSGAFDSEKPQVFELDAATTIHPLANGFILQQPRPTSVSSSTTSLLLETGSAGLKAGDIVLVQVKGQTSSTQVRTVKSAAVVTAADEAKYLQVVFTSALSLSAGTTPASIQLSTPTQRASLWTAAGAQSKALKVTGSQSLTVILDGRYPQIKPADFVILAVGTTYSWYQVAQVSETTMPVTAGGAVNVLDKNGNSVSVVAPPVNTPATQLALTGQAVTLQSADAAKVVVHYSFVGGAVVTLAAKTTLSAGDTLRADSTLEEPSGYQAPTRFLLEDKNGSGVSVGASLNWGSGALALDQGTQWSPALVAPVEVYGNVVSASCGQTVSAETLGSGNASKSNQSFTLKKKPLTYMSAPTVSDERGVTSSLKVYVGDILWSEVASFYGAAPDAQVYIVRQNDDGESVVTFGDGKRGARLPSGSGNVVAYYRYGAGAASPPAGGINQLAKPVKGLKSVRNPVAASGGGDAESTTNLRAYAPRSALLLGRAVSIQDMEVAAAGVSGVRAVAVEWRWQASQQRPAVQVWYIGQAGLESTVAQRLRRLSDPTVPIAVTRATGVPAQLALSLEIDARRVVDTVLAAVRSALTDTQTGLLAPEQIGIGRPLYRSRVFEAVLAVAGTVAVEGILWNGAAWSAFALAPGAGKYFDLESGALLLSGKVDSNG